MDLSFQEKNGLKIRYLVVEILSKNLVSFFLGHPVGSGTIKGMVTVIEVVSVLGIVKILRKGSLD